MGKNPADQFYWLDFYRDLHEHPLEIVGAWILILCKLWYEPDRGQGTKTLEAWSKIFSAKSKKNALKILKYLKDSNISTIPTDLSKNASYYGFEHPITVISRKMVEREKRRKSDTLYNKDYYENLKKKDKSELNSRQIQENFKPDPKIIQAEIPISSSYLLTSSIKKQLPKSEQPVDNLETEPQDEYAEHIDQLRDKLGLSYWRTGRDNVHSWIMYQVKKKIKAKAILYCLVRVDEERPDHPWAYCEGILKKYNDSELHKKDNIFMDIVDKMKRIQHESP